MRRSKQTKSKKRCTMHDVHRLLHLWIQRRHFRVFVESIFDREHREHKFIHNIRDLILTRIRTRTVLLAAQEIVLFSAIISSPIVSSISEEFETVPCGLFFQGIWRSFRVPGTAVWPFPKSVFIFIFLASNPHGCLSIWFCFEVIRNLFLQCLRGDWGKISTLLLANIFCLSPTQLKFAPQEAVAVNLDPVRFAGLNTLFFTTVTCPSYLIEKIFYICFWFVFWNKL